MFRNRFVDALHIVRQGWQQFGMVFQQGQPGIHVLDDVLRLGNEFDGKRQVVFVPRQRRDFGQ